MYVVLNPSSVDDYRMFIRVKELPAWQIRGRLATIPDEYASLVLPNADISVASHNGYVPPEWMFDYQKDITRMALKKRKFALFMDCGSGKTHVLLDFAKNALPNIKGKGVLIISPLMVVTQTIAEAERFFPDMVIDKVVSSNLQSWLNDCGGRIGITNYEALRNEVTRGQLGGLILDECFAPSTLIDVVNPLDSSLGRKYIKDVLHGDHIINAIGVDHVKHVWKRPIDGAVRLCANGSEITCSSHHPFFTLHGWRFAEDLQAGDYVMEAKTAMCLVRDKLCTEITWPENGSILREILLSEVANEYARIQSKSTYSGNVSQDWQTIQSGVGSEDARRNETLLQTVAKSKSFTRGGGAEEDIQYSATDGMGTIDTWRKWSWNDRAAGAVACRITREVGGRACNQFRPTPARLPDMLQGRSSLSGTQDCNRSRRSLSPISEGIGREERSKTGFSRVDSVEILELGHHDLDQYRDADGHVYFYDIETEQHPSYSVNGLLVHNSSMLKSFTGTYGLRLIDLGKGIEYKLCCTGTPAPNDRIEYANHAVFLDVFPTVNSFLATYFINRGQTQERWALKDHALKPFYRSLSHWCIFMTNPATYGWKDNCNNIPPINIHIHEVDMTQEQKDLVRSMTGLLFATDIGGITSRAAMGQIAKGNYKGKKIATKKPAYIKSLIDQWPEESTIIWCLFNEEQQLLARTFPEAANITGTTPYAKRQVLIDEFKAGTRKVMISKPRILGFGLNLQIATRQVFSGLADSYESMYQAVKRSNRVGSTRPLNVHIPVTDIEEPMVQNVLRKAHRIDEDTKEQEALFKAEGQLAWQ